MVASRVSNDGRMSVKLMKMIDTKIDKIAPKSIDLKPANFAIDGRPFPR